MPAYRLVTNTIALLALSVASPASAQDVQVQSENGRLVIGSALVNENTGGIDDTTFSLSIGDRVFTEPLGTNFSSPNPGFNVEPTLNIDGSDNALLPAGVEGLGQGTELFVDFVPVTIGGVTSNFFFWDGSDANDDGDITVEDIDFQIPADGRALGFATDTAITDFVGGNEVQRSGRIEATSVLEPILGVPGGRLHEHGTFAVLPSEGAGLSSDQPDGIYVTALRAVAEGFEDSDPFLFVFESLDFDPSSSLSSVTELVAEFLDDNYDEIAGLAGPPGDFNFDDVVNAADFTVLRDGAAPLDLAEGFDEFVANFDTAGGLGAEAGAVGSLLTTGATVPEPSAMALVALAATLAAGRRRRQ